MGAGKGWMGMNRVDGRTPWRCVQELLNVNERSSMKEFISPWLERRYLMLGGDTDPVLVPKGLQDPKGPWMGF